MPNQSSCPWWIKSVAIWSALTVAAAIFIGPMFVMIFWGLMGAALVVYFVATSAGRRLHVMAMRSRLRGQ